MPLRVTIELIPRGDESKKRKVAVVTINNNCTGTQEFGNYDVHAEGECVGGWDTFAQKKVSGLKRGDYVNCAAECLMALHTQNAGGQVHEV